jgi:hypothetical protein
MVRTQLIIKIFSLVLVMGGSLPVLGQTLSISGVVMKSGTSEVLPFVTVAVKNASRGTVTDAKGGFTTETKAGDTLIVSSVGFKTIQLVSAHSSGTIYLEEEAEVLNEVLVSASRRTKKVNLGNIKEKTFLATGGANQYAKLFLNESGVEGILESITFDFQPEAKKYGRYMTAIMIRVYKNENGRPGSDILLEKVIVPIKENQKEAVIDLSKFNITFVQEGLFVGFDFIGYYDGSEIFTPYNRIKTPANVRIEFAKADSSDTFSKFFGTSWRKVTHTDRNGGITAISAKFSVRVKF